MPRSRSLVIESVVTKSVEKESKTMQIQARHDVEDGQLLGIVTGVDDELERGGLRRTASYRRQVALQGGVERSQGRRRIADRGWVGGVGVDQDRGRIAAIDGAVEAWWDFDHEKQIAVGQALIGLQLPTTKVQRL